MNLRLLPLALLLCACLAQAHTPGRPTPQAIDEVVQATIARYDLPGIAVGVIVRVCLCVDNGQKQTLGLAKAREKRSVRNAAKRKGRD